MRTYIKIPTLFQTIVLILKNVIHIFNLNFLIFDLLPKRINPCLNNCMNIYSLRTDYSAGCFTLC